MRVELHEATRDDLHVVKNLVPYYVYDMSEHTAWACSPDGRFDGCDDLESFWAEEPPRRLRHPFVFKHETEWAGFAMVRSDHDDPCVDHAMAEFFVLRKFRGKGVGRRMAEALWQRFPGRWEVTQLNANRPAVEFWRRVIGRSAAVHETTRSSPWGPMNVMRFSTPPPDEQQDSPSDARA